MENIKITVFTPTYNRANNLEKLFKSLEKQIYKNFEWLIVDDGSEDDTENVVKEFQRKSKIDINYFKQVNSGKHVAINNGVEKAKGELFFIVDSDDYLNENSLKIVVKAWNSIENKETFIGIGGRRLFINKKNYEFNFKEKYFDCNAIDFNLKYKNMQDKAEVFETKKLKEYKFKNFEGEKFMTEAVVWYKMAEDGYKIRWINEDIYICEYLEGGLSSTFYKQRVKSLNSTCYSYNLLSSYNLPIKYKIRYKSNYFRYGLVNFELKKMVNDLINKQYLIISVFIGYLLKFKDSLKYKE